MKSIWHRRGLIAKNSFEALQNDKGNKEEVIQNAKTGLEKEITKEGLKVAAAPKNSSPNGKEK